MAANGTDLLIKLLKYSFSDYSSNTSLNRLILIDLDPLLKFKSAGGNIGSIAILNALSSILGIILDKIGQVVSRQGFVLISIRLTPKSSSIMKSYPKISNW